MRHIDRQADRQKKGHRHDPDTQKRDIDKTHCEKEKTDIHRERQRDTRIERDRETDSAEAVLGLNGVSSGFP